MILRNGTSKEVGMMKYCAEIVSFSYARSQSLNSINESGEPAQLINYKHSALAKSTGSLLKAATFLLSHDLFFRGSKLKLRRSNTEASRLFARRKFMAPIQMVMATFCFQCLINSSIWYWTSIYFSQFFYRFTQNVDVLVLSSGGCRNESHLSPFSRTKDSCGANYHSLFVAHW